jgi:hypothetical protein
MKPIPYFLFFLIVLFMFGKSLAQGDYREGYIVTNNGDTIHGFIDYQEWEFNPESILFTLRLGPVGTPFGIRDLQAFGVMKKPYRRHIVEIINTPRRKNQNRPVRTTSVTDTVFLQVLVEGEKTLYYLGDEYGEKYFIQPGGNVEMLVNTSDMDEPADKDALSKGTYRGQLADYLSACSSITDILPLVEYKAEDMINLFKHYARCSKSRIDYSLKMTRAKLEWGIIAGPVYTGFNVVGDNYAYQGRVNTDFSYSLDFAIGISSNIIFPMSIPGQISANMEFMYNSYMTEGYEYGTSYMQFGCKYINWNMMLRYYYPIKKVNVFANGGVSLGYALQMTNYCPDRINEEAFKNPNELEYGYLLGLGGDYRKFSLELRYEKRNGTLTQTDVAAVTSRYYAILGYKLGKTKRKKF